MSCVYIVTDQRPGEPDILTPAKHYPLVLSVNGKSVASCPAPANGWEHETLQATVDELCVYLSAAGVTDAYLGGEWVGSSEV